MANESKRVDRRNFLRTIGGGSAVAAAAVASPLMNTEAEAYNPGNEQTKARYRETEHVKKFYASNGYETLKNK